RLDRRREGPAARARRGGRHVFGAGRRTPPDLRFVPPRRGRGPPAPILVGAQRGRCPVPMGPAVRPMFNLRSARSRNRWTGSSNDDVAQPPASVSRARRPAHHGQMAAPTAPTRRSLTLVDLGSLLFLGAVWGAAFLFLRV